MKISFAIRIGSLLRDEGVKAVVLRLHGGLRVFGDPQVGGRDEAAGSVLRHALCMWQGTRYCTPRWRRIKGSDLTT